LHANVPLTPRLPSLNSKDDITVVVFKALAKLDWGVRMVVQSAASMAQEAEVVL